jgi:N-acetylglutamate synthase-like GNAT family acetyltransferase
MTERPANIRFGVPSDENAILDLMRAAYKEQPVFPLNEDKMRDRIKECLKLKNGFMAVTTDDKGGPVGYLIATVSSFWYTDSHMVEELSNFVHPDYRTSGSRGKHLIEFAKWFAEQMDLPLIFSILSTQRLAAKTRLYQRQGTLAGAVFVHNTGHIEGLLSEMG